MITTNVLSRVFHIAWGDSTGTAFAIDHASKQYLVTARHVVKEIDSGDSIRVFHGVGARKQVFVAALAIVTAEGA